MNELLYHITIYLDIYSFEFLVPMHNLIEEFTIVFINIKIDFTHYMASHKIEGFYSFYSFIDWILLFLFI